MRTCLLLCACLLLSWSSSPADVPDLYDFETFNSMAGCNTDSTTANWDTAAGQLHLHPLEITAAGNYNSAGTAYHLAVAGDYAYLADGSAGLQIVDITDPAAPSHLGTLDTSGMAFGVALRGSYAYVADGTHGLQVVDVSDPTWPLLAGGVSTPGSSYDVAVAGHYAYVADRSGGLQIVDVSNPYIPVVVGSAATPDNAYGVELYGNYCYVAASSAGLQIFDVSDPTAPSLAGTETLSGYAWDLVAAGGLAYVACDAGGLWILDLAKPTAPGVVSTTGLAGPALDVALDGRYVYASLSGAGLQVVDVADPVAPVLRRMYDSPGTAWAAWPAGAHCYLADGTAGMQVLSFREAIQPQTTGYIVTGSLELETSGTIAYNVYWSDGLRSYDVSGPSTPQLLDSTSDMDAKDLQVRGRYAYVAAQTDGLRIYDVSSPQNLTFVGSRATTNSYDRISVDGGLAALANGTQGVDLIDVTDPANPSRVGVIQPSIDVGEVLLHGDVLYVASTGRVDAFDVSAPETPVPLASYDPAIVEFVRLMVHGDVLYMILRDDSGVDPETRILAHDAATLAWLGTANVYDALFEDFSISGDLLVAVGTTGSCGFDITDPTDPTRVWTSTGPAHAVAFAGDYLVRGYSTVSVACAWERALDLDRNRARSTVLNTLDRDVVCALSAPRTNLIGTSFVEISADGENWESTSLYSSGLHYFPTPGPSLQWRATLVSDGSEIDGDPQIFWAETSWRYDCAFIDEIADVPNDQGRQVSVNWVASGYDRLDSPTPIHEYAVYRRIDPALKADPLPGEKLDGDWHFLMTVPASCDDEYAVVVPTLADSTVADGLRESVFAVRALTDTPGVFFESPPDTGYSVDNLAPGVPSGLKQQAADQLAWDEATDPDFRYFSVYGSATDHLDGTEVLVAHTTSPGQDISGHDHAYFLITATDFSGNESAAASLVDVSAVPGAAPRAFALHQCVPNPFNPATTIAYDLPEAARVNLRIFDVAGRLVRVLAPGETVTAGHHEVRWDGLDDMGRAAGAGIYFCRLEAGGHGGTRRMVLVR